MYEKNDNYYQFKYLITGISGPGVEGVYLPDTPDESEILWKEQNRFVRETLPKEWREWKREEAYRQEADPEYVHPKISEFIELQWHRREHGVHFWNNGQIEYITGFHWWMLTWWKPYFGFCKFRDTDKEICYFIQYCEEDPFCFGTLLNTVRRYGKSTLMGAWIIERMTRLRGAQGGMQGETDKKIKKFYNKMVLKPFFKLPSFFQPVYDTSSTQAQSIVFDEPKSRGKTKSLLDHDYEEGPLESIIDYQSSGEGEYDGDELSAYLMEEPGKTLECSVWERWDVVKPCLKKGTGVRGKALLGTTVENMETKGRGGAAYKQLLYESDYDKKTKNGFTESGLYFAFIPGQFALEDFVDEWGYPDEEKSREWLNNELVALKDKPRKYAGQIRKYPRNLKEIFYVSPETCVFNVTILMDRKFELDAIGSKAYVRGNFKWQNGKRDTRVVWVPSSNGAFKVSQLIERKEDTNKIQQVGVNSEGKPMFKPLNNHLYSCGCDPIQHGATSGGRIASKPVLYVKTKYNPEIDGPWDFDLLEQRAREKYPYKTNRYICQYDVRYEPNKFFENALMMAVYFGISINVERQKNSIINYFHERGYGHFIHMKYKPVSEQIRSQNSKQQIIQGTDASRPTIDTYTTKLDTYIEYFGHTIPFIEQVDDYLIFDPHNTKDHDYSVASGYTELADDIRVKKEKKIINLDEFMNTWDNSGNQSVLIS